MAATNGNQPRELFLIDGNSLAYRAFFALPESIATSDGRPTNAMRTRLGSWSRVSVLPTSGSRSITFASTSSMPVRCNAVSAPLG